MGILQGKLEFGPASARWLPFAVFMAFIGAEEGLRIFAERGIYSVSPEFLMYLYPLRLILVVGILYSFRDRYYEIIGRDLYKIPALTLSLAIGLFVFICWISLDSWVFRGAGASHGYNPKLLSEQMQLPIIIIRALGAIVVVPVMEELFWRSYLIRYIENSDFEKVQIGHFSWASFVVTIVLFGFEHQMILAGMIAGFFYNMLIYRTKSLMLCILAHSFTNMILTFYVLYLGRWDLW